MSRALLVLALSSGLSQPLAGARQFVAVPVPQQTGISSQTAVRTGAVLGRVVDAATGQSIPRAIVRMVGASGFSPEGAVAITGPRGQFVFRDLAAGKQSLYAEAAGYLQGSYGQRRPEGSARTIVVRDNEITTDAEIKLWKAAAISGTIFDESGPAVQITVAAYRRSMVRGKVQLGQVATAVSDERGIYRLHSLVPGDYLVAMTTNITSIPVSASEAYWKAAEAVQPGGSIDPSQRRTMSELSAAQTMSAMGGVTVRNQQVYTWYNRPLAPSPGNEDRFLIYPTVFHPAAATPRGAAVITVGSGDDRQGVDLQIAMAQTFAISGAATGPDGPVANAPLRLVPAYAEEVGADAVFVTSASSTDAQGRFTVVGVPPGDYLLSTARAPMNGDGPIMMANGTVIMMNPGSPVTPADPAGDIYLWAESPVSVGDRDVSDLALTMQPGFRISGTLDFVGTAAKPAPARLAQVQFYVDRADGRSMRLPFARVSQAGTFSTGQYPAGRYQLGLIMPIPGWFLKSIAVGGRELLGRAVDLSKDLEGVVVTLIDQQTSVSGTVQRSGSNADVKATVAIFPSDYEDWIASGMTRLRARLIDTAPNGAFEIGNVVPGTYLIAAVDGSTPVELQDPKDIAALARIATRVTVADGEQKNVPLTIARIR